MSETEKPTAHTQHKAFAAMADAAALPRLLRAGTKAMRKSADWTPKSPGENAEHYALRLSRSFLLGKYEDVCDELANAMFSGSLSVEPENADPKAEEKPELDPQVTAWVEDFDAQGQTLEDWSIAAFGKALDCGVVHAVVDHPNLAPSENREQELAKGARPYATLFAGDDVLQVERSRDGKRILRINIRVPRLEIEGWGERTREQTLVAYAGDPAEQDTSIGSLRWARWELRELVKDEATGSVSDAIVGHGSYRPHVEIPIRTFYTRRTGFMTGKPALARLAEKNAEHWQSSSHQRMNLDFSRFAMIFRKGFNEDEKNQKLTGAAVMFDAKAEHGDMKTIESTGAALAAGRQHLEDCKAEMESMALSPRMKMGATTAAEIMIEKGEADSQIGAWALSFERFLQGILGLMARWVTPAEQPEAPSFGVVSLAMDDALVMPPSQIELVKYLREKNDISQRTILRMAKESGLLPVWVDIDAEIEATKTSAPSLLGVPLPFQRATPTPDPAEAPPTAGEPKA